MFSIYYIIYIQVPRYNSLYKCFLIVRSYIFICVSVNLETILYVNIDWNLYKYKNNRNYQKSTSLTYKSNQFSLGIFCTYFAQLIKGRDVFTSQKTLNMGILITIENHEMTLLICQNSIFCIGNHSNYTIVI